MNTDKLSRRGFLQAVGATAGVAFLAACAPTVAPSAGEGGAAPAAEAIAMELWTFVNTHARWFRSMFEDYKADVNPNLELEVIEIAYGEMHDKLQIALQTGGVGAPDLADIEQGRFGGFLRGADPGLVDLKQRLTEGGYLDDLVASREQLYTYEGKIYGIEHALTPVVLYYRADVYEDAALNLEEVETWDDFFEMAKQVSSDDVKALPFPIHEVLLRQRGSDYFDEEGNITLDLGLSIETMDSILGLRDSHGIADQSPGDGVYSDAWWAAVRDGQYLGHVGADWYAGFFKDNAPELSGTMKAIPIPAWEAGGIRTSSHGGTGNCIVKTSPNVEEAWKFQQYTMLSIEGNVRRYEMTNLFPPYIPAMTDERLHKPDEYFSGQDLGALFQEVAPDVPPQYQSPYRAEMNAKLTSEWQAIYDGDRTPEDVFTTVAEDIRQVMAAEQG